MGYTKIIKHDIYTDMPIVYIHIGKRWAMFGMCPRSGCMDGMWICQAEHSSWYLCLCLCVCVYVCVYVYVCECASGNVWSDGADCGLWCDGVLLLLPRCLRHHRCHRHWSSSKSTPLPLPSVRFVIYCWQVANTPADKYIRKAPIKHTSNTDSNIDVGFA